MTDEKAEKSASSDIPEDIDSADQSEQPVEGSDAETPAGPRPKRWYVLRVASNREEQVRDALARKVEIEHLDDEIGRVLVPTEKVKRVRAGQQRIYARKLYPGYVFVEMATSDDGGLLERSWFLINETAGVGDFIGTEGKPSPMSDADVAKMLNQAETPEESPQVQVEFDKGDAVKIKGGSFEGMEGTVENVDAEKGTVRVIVTIFNRPTPLDIEYWQIEKA